MSEGHLKKSTGSSGHLLKGDVNYHLVNICCPAQTVDITIAGASLDTSNCINHWPNGTFEVLPWENYDLNFTALSNINGSYTFDLVTFGAGTPYSHEAGICSYDMSESSDPAGTSIGTVSFASYEHFLPPPHGDCDESAVYMTGSAGMTIRALNLHAGGTGSIYSDVGIYADSGAINRVRLNVDIYIPDASAFHGDPSSEHRPIPISIFDSGYLADDVYYPGDAIPNRLSIDSSDHPFYDEINYINQRWIVTNGTATVTLNT